MQYYNCLRLYPEYFWHYYSLLDRYYKLLYSCTRSFHYCEAVPHWFQKDFLLPAWIDKPLLHLDTHTNPECGVGINIQLALQDFYREIQKTAEKKMQEITLQDIVERYYQKLKTNAEDVHL